MAEFSNGVLTRDLSTSEDLLTVALDKKRRGLPLTPEEAAAVTPRGVAGSYLDPLLDLAGRLDPSALFGIGSDALRPIFRQGSAKPTVGVDAMTEAAMLPKHVFPLAPASDLPAPTPEDRALQLTALGIGGGGGASASFKGGPGMAKVAGPKRYDVESFLKQLESLPLPKQREALVALQAANPEVNRQNFTGKDDVAMRGVSDALLAMAGGLADPNKSFAQSLVGAGERGFKSYDDREDKAVKEQMDARLARLTQGKELNDAERADYNAQAGKLTTLGKGYGDLNKDEIDLFSARSNDASRRAQAGIQSASLAQQSAARGAAKQQQEAMLELALNAEGKSLMGRKGYAQAGNKDILAASMALRGKEAKHGDDANPYATLTKTLGEEKAKALVLDPTNATLSLDELMAKALGGDKAKIGVPK